MKWLLALILGCLCVAAAAAQPVRSDLVWRHKAQALRPAPRPTSRLVLLAYVGPRRIPVYVRTCSRAPRTDPALAMILSQIVANQNAIMQQLNNLQASHAAMLGKLAAPVPQQQQPIIVVHGPAAAPPSASPCPNCDCASTPPTPPTPPTPAPVLPTTPSAPPVIVIPSAPPAVTPPSPPTVTRPAPPVVVAPGSVPPVVPMDSKAEKLPGPMVEMRQVGGRVVYYVNLQAPKRK